MSAAIALDVAVAGLRAWRRPTRVIGRHTGALEREVRPLGERVQIVAGWTTVTGGRLLVRTPWFRRYLARLTQATGDRMDAPATVAELGAFAADYDIDLDELDRPLASFATVNDLFARPLRPGARPLAGGPDVAVSPVDGRVRAVERIGERLDVKGRAVSLPSLLGLDGPSGPGRDAARAFFDAGVAGGFAVVLARLAPGDYHRFHAPVDGHWRAEALADVLGDFHPVAARALTGPLDVLGRNRKVTLVIDGARSGPVAFVAVGAVKVGSVEVTAVPGPVGRGDELGRFRYGGSTVAVVFHRARVALDADLLANTAAGFETRIRLGQSIGRVRP